MDADAEGLGEGWRAAGGRDGLPKAPARPVAAPLGPGKGVVALVDCTSFYVACERLFDPKLRARPVAVLSNGDGCIVARSKEVKALGIPMGAPAFTVREDVRRHGIVLRSSNYPLYADLSHRVMETLATFSDSLEVYSIDEAFLRLPALNTEGLQAIADEMHARVLAWTGIPVHVGIGPTKGLAKLASEAATRRTGALALSLGADTDALLAITPVSELWGIGRQLTRRLAAHGVATALQLRDVPLPWARKHLTVTGERLVLELRGLPCLGVNDPAGPRRTICRSRSFGEPVEDLATLRRAVATYTSRAAEKARALGLAPRGISVFVTTKHHGAGPHWSGSLAATLDRRTSFTPALADAADRLVQRLWRDRSPDGRRYRYRKAGVLLLDLAPESEAQGHLWGGMPDPKEAALMTALDAVNGRYGSGTVRLASSAASMGRRDEAWQMRQALRSPAYTTDWKQLPTAW